MTRLITLVLTVVMACGAQSIRVGQIRTSETGVFNVKTSPFNAKGNGTTDDTAAIQAALVAGAGKVVYFPPGEYKVSSTLTPAEATVINGPGTTMTNSVYTTRIRYFDDNTPLFNVIHSGIKISGMWLYQSPTITPVNGNIGIKITSGAISATVNNVMVTGFYDGIDAQGGGGQTNLTDVTSQNNLHDGFVSRLCQGLWSNVSSIANVRHGFYITTGTGSTPWLIGGGTFGNGGWGIYADGTITGIDGMFLNNDSLGEINLDFTSSDSGLITNTIIQWAGWNMFTQGLDPADTSNQFTGAQLSRQVLAATNASPIEITVGAAHGMTGPTSVDCSHIAGNTAANGTFTATPVVGQPTKFTLGGTTGNGALVIPATCPTAGLYDNFCPKCSRATDSYRTIADSPSVLIGAGAEALIMSGNKIYGSNGNSIESAAPNLSLMNNTVLGSGGGLTTTDFFGLNLSGSFSQIADNFVVGASSIAGSQNSITGNRFSSSSPTPVAFAALGTPADGTTTYCYDCKPSLNPCQGSGTGAVAYRVAGAWNCLANTPATIDIPSGTEVVFSANRIYNNIGMAAPGVAITAGVTRIKGDNFVVGTVVDAGAWSQYTNPKELFSYPVAFADLGAASAGKIQYCQDCKVTSATNSTCVGGGTGATAFSTSTTWTCVFNPLTEGADGVVTVRKGDDSGTCTITFTKGLYASTTCP